MARRKRIKGRRTLLYKTERKAGALHRLAKSVNKRKGAFARLK